MKHLPFLLISLFFLQNASAQSCLPGGITFTDQSQINAFPSMNPGCKQILGPVNVQGANITGLDSLYNIERIDGDLLITANDNLTGLQGLNNLTTVGLAMRVQNNPLLNSLDGLNNLSAVRGDFFYIGNNALVSNIQALSQLDSVYGIFQVWGQDLLTSLSGLGQLSHVGATLAVFQNPELITFGNGLQLIEHIGNDLRIEDNPKLNNISSLDHPVDVNGALAIIGNTVLSDCAVESVCDYIATPVTFVAISGNGSGCVSEMVVQSMCISSTEEQAFRAGINLFPNPATDRIIVRDAEGNPLQFARMFDVMGKNITMPGLNTDGSVDLSALVGGLYGLEVVSGKHRTMVVFVKL